MERGKYSCSPGTNFAKLKCCRGGNASWGLAAVLARAGSERGRLQPQSACAPSVKYSRIMAFAGITWYRHMLPSTGAVEECAVHGTV